MKFKNTGIGFLAGLAVIAYTYATYALDKERLFTGTFYFSSLLIYAGFMYWAAAHTAKASLALPVVAAQNLGEDETPEENEGDFRGTLRSAFWVFLLANACYYGFDFFLYNYFDPMMNQIQAEAAIELYRPATPTDEMAKLEETIRKSNIHDAKSLLFQFGKGAIGGFGLSVILTFFALRNGKK